MKNLEMLSSVTMKNFPQENLHIKKNLRAIRFETIRSKRHFLRILDSVEIISWLDE